MELQAQAGVGGCQEDDRIDGGAAGGQIELQAQAGGGGGGQGEDRIYGGVAGGQVELVLLEDRWSSWPRLVLEAGRERTEFMVVLLEDSWSSRLAVGGAGRGHK